MRRWIALVLVSCVFTLSGCTKAVSESVGQEDNNTTTESLSKPDELKRVDSAATAEKVTENPDEWQGTYVRFPCQIVNVMTDLPGGPFASATCGQSVTLTRGTAPNFDYSDPDAPTRSSAQTENSMREQVEKARDAGMMLLTGDRVKNFDGGQVVTITGMVVPNTPQGINAMATDLGFTTVRVDYAE